MADLLKAIAVSFASSSLTVGQTTQAIVTPTFTVTDGAMTDDYAFAFSSSAPAVATVSTTGVVTAVAPGTATIAASSGTVQGSATLTVQSVPFVVISVPDMDWLLKSALGTKFELRDSNGRVVLCQVNG